MVPTSERPTGGQALARSLVAQGVSTIFALPGVQLDWAFDALYEVRDQLRVIHIRHEQATACMADGYARSTGQPGVCLMVPGPGLLNASAALATAYACSSPGVCVTGQVDSHAIDAGYGLLHEVEHQDRILHSLNASTASTISSRSSSTTAAFGMAFGVEAERVNTGSQLESTLRSALAGRRPALIEISTRPMSNAWPVIGPAGGIYPILLEPLK
jgi:thiamine pyrophosphate-dependent acetolactate synthase large subunit-like protein